MLAVPTPETQVPGSLLPRDYRWEEFQIKVVTEAQPGPWRVLISPRRSWWLGNPQAIAQAVRQPAIKRECSISPETGANC